MYVAADDCTGPRQARNTGHSQGIVQAISVLANLADATALVLSTQAQLRACVFAVIEEQDGKSYDTGWLLSNPPIAAYFTATLQQLQILREVLANPERRSFSATMKAHCWPN